MKFIWALITAVCMTTSVQAGSILGNEERCVWLANIAGTAATHRDMGMTWDDAHEQIEAGIAAATGVPGSLIQDDEDAELVRAMMKSIWNSDMEPHFIAMEVLSACVESTPIAKM